MADSESVADDLTDDALQSEIELVGELVVAATSSGRRLSQEEIDALLGVSPPADRRKAEERPGGS